MATSTESFPPSQSKQFASTGLSRLMIGLLAIALLPSCALMNASDPSTPSIASERSSPFLANTRQLTFAGRRTGEGYFSASGRDIVFQSEREPGNPFYQIYRMDLESGYSKRVSNGVGKTTCGWIHPDGTRVLYASTHLDPDAIAKQAQELEDREAGTTKRYAWDYDPHYDLFVAEADGSTLQLTDAHGYDAEASFSPNGRYVAFSSNRHAYAAPLGPAERERLADNPQHFIDLYLLDTQTGETHRLTEHPGYDGGPFFSPDGTRIVWRRFSEDGARAEIHSIRIDGEDERILTRLGVMSWAPYYHPSGDYLVFNTNVHGYANFELYMVDAEGLRDPVRVTHAEGFDALGVFSPRGDELLWTSTRTSNGKSQLFLADWDDIGARRALDLAPSTSESLPVASTDPDITRADLLHHVVALTNPMTEGRATGTRGESIAGKYIARAFEAAGLVPAGDNDEWQHDFTFTAGISLGENNALNAQTGDDSAALIAGELDTDWRPLAFSRSGSFEAADVVFGGYGVVAPASEDLAAIDEYGDLDVAEKWLLIFRDLPQDLPEAQRTRLRRYAGLRFKAMIARDRGARGVLFVSGPESGFRAPLVPLRFDASLSGTSIAALSLSDAFANELLAAEDTTVDALQADANRALISEASVARAFERLNLTAEIDLETEKRIGHNIIGRLQVGPTPSKQTIVLGAHYDHLGRGVGSSSLADASESGAIHGGADDNASGTAVVLELAEALASLSRDGLDLGPRDFIFAAWSGEELGLLGSNAWVDETVNPHDPDVGPVAYLNFDMVGRLREHLIVQGMGSSDDWTKFLEPAAVPLGLSIQPQQDSYIPSDATSFYTQGVPVLAAFTGVHPEYHTPRDTAELLNLDGMVGVGHLFLRVAAAIARAPEPPIYRAQEAPAAGQGRTGFRVFLGTIPDYANTDVVGVLLSGVAPNGPALRGGLQRGDIIISVDERKIENLYDYTYALEAMRVDEPVTIGILRNGERLDLEVVPASRD